MYRDVSNFVLSCDFCIRLKPYSIKPAPLQNIWIPRRPGEFCSIDLRSSDRSWRHLWAILRNNILYLLKERREPSKGTVTGEEHVIDVQNSMANVANDYMKRKHVLRLLLFNGTEYLVQTESHASMMEWLKALQIFARQFAEHIPLIVELCVQIVENRGLDVVGIYRVPGNNASVSVLTDMVNQGIDDVVLQDARWNDVNIVSSLLKAFFRKLPEPLLTSYLYPKFIQASKIEDPMKRLKAIKHVLYHLPVHYFATLRYLMYHLKKVVEHCATNKMEARNLAIVFGPTLVRTTDNNMVTMVTDMSHQCYLIESMIVYAEWLFEDCGDLLPLEVNAQDKRKTHPPSNMQSNALLSNINKLDDNALELPHEIFTSFYNTAARHLRHRNKKKDASVNSKKRSGIIADDNEMLIGENLNSSVTSSHDSSENQNSIQTETKNLADMSFGSCSSLISGSSKTKQRSLSKERASRNGSLEPPVDSELRSEMAAEESVPNVEEDPVHHRYNELSALAQEKIKNFEQETKALLRRDFQRPRTSVGTPQVEWEQIEREWQKAKMELEQEDLLDFLADDPSCLSCLLNRDESAVDLSPMAERQGTTLNRKSELPGSLSSCSMREFLHCEDSGRFRNSRSPEDQSDKTVLNSSRNILMPRSITESYRTRNNRAEISSSLSQPALTMAISERTANTQARKEYSSEESSTKPDDSSTSRSEESERVTTGEESVPLSCGSDVINASSLS
ncbi:rho GTPase-activating protein 21-like [Uloborus diversus]|uniref:rho GTPase-activating protein 21-like n=1 Tax=Uloborus diversus TaxID=327109 RepID=UPI00240A7FFB|nr:rho GTPase-activating protein 21-like [Uloborus diversus]